MNPDELISLWDTRDTKVYKHTIISDLYSDIDYDINGMPKTTMAYYNEYDPTTGIKAYREYTTSPGTEIRYDTRTQQATIKEPVPTTPIFDSGLAHDYTDKFHDVVEQLSKTDKYNDIGTIKKCLGDMEFHSGADPTCFTNGRIDPHEIHKMLCSAHLTVDVLMSKLQKMLPVVEATKEFIQQLGQEKDTKVDIVDDFVKKLSEITSK